MVMSSVPSNVAAHATATSAPDHSVWFQHFKRLYTHSSGKIDENGYFRTFTPGISLGEEEAQRMKRGGGLHPARLYWWPPTTWGIPTDRWVWVVTLRPQQREAPPNRRGPTPPRPTSLQLSPYMVAARLMALLWPGPDTPTQNYPHLTEDDMPSIQRCFFRTLDYLQQTHLHVLEQIWQPPG